MNSTLLRTLIKSLSFGLTDVFLWWGWGNEIWATTWLKWKPFLVHHCSYLITGKLILIYWLKWYLLGFFTGKLLFSICNWHVCWGTLRWDYANIIFLPKISSLTVVIISGFFLLHFLPLPLGPLIPPSSLLINTLLSTSVSPFYFFSLVFFNLFFFVQVHLSPYSCQNFPPTHTHPPPTIIYSFPLLALSMEHLYMFFDNPSLCIPRYAPPLSPLVTVSLYFISMSLVILCLLICFVDYFHS